MTERRPTSDDDEDAETVEQLTPRIALAADVPARWEQLLGDCNVCGGQCVDHWAEEAMHAGEGSK
jgi:hypothetical protein